MENKLKIALTFSGGGYRAATFHLGTLSYRFVNLMNGRNKRCRLLIYNQ